jgi:CubicO group peptidase (beta-lactamase class C family)
MVVALQAVGAAAGNMIAIHNVVAASATVGLLGQEGSTLRKTILPTLYYLLVVGTLGLVSIYGLKTQDPLQATQQTESAREIVSGELGAAFDDYMRGQETDSFSGALLVVRGDDVVLSKGYGQANPEAGYPNSPATVFDMGSIVKTFTLAAVLKLEEEGLLTTDDRLSAFLVDVPADKADITVDQLITMSAGFREYHDETGDFQQMHREEAVARILSQELRFKPGTDRAYSNSGYTLLAVIVELASGTALHEFLRAKLFEPAGMQSTGFYGAKIVHDRHVAIGFDGITTFGAINAPPYWPEVTWALKGSGGVFGSLADLHRWKRAVDDGVVLGPQAREKYETYRSPMRTGEGRLVHFHAGGNDFGFVFVMLDLIDEDGLIVFAQNNNPVGEEDPQLVRDLIEIFRTTGDGSP